MTKYITIHKNIKSADSPYCMIGNEELSQAMRNLSGSAFKLYVYLCKNQNNVQWLLHESSAIKFTGLSKSAYYRAIEELKTKKYITTSQDQLEFHEQL